MGMNSLGFYAPKQVSIEDIAICAMKAGFKTGFAPPRKVRLMVEYVVEVDGEYITASWAVGNSNISQLANENPALLGDYELILWEKLKPNSTFYILFHPYSMRRLMDLLKALLECFGGWIVSHETGDYYSADNLEDSIDKMVPSG